LYGAAEQRVKVRERYEYAEIYSKIVCILYAPHKVPKMAVSWEFLSLCLMLEFMFEPDLLSQAYPYGEVARIESRADSRASSVPEILQLA
jgi:hypothetical protein